MKLTTGSALAAIAMFVALIGCQAEPKTPQERHALLDESHGTLSAMQQLDPSITGYVDHAYGYAIFPSVGAAGAIIGGAYGRGAVYEQGNFVGYADLTQANIGATLGGQTYAELICFQNRDAMQKFKNGQLALSADASAVMLKSGASAALNYSNGVAIFTKPKGGAMVQAAIGGQHFSFEPANAPQWNNSNSNANENNNNENTNQDNQAPVRHSMP